MCEFAVKPIAVNIFKNKASEITLPAYLATPTWYIIQNHVSSLYFPSSANIKAELSEEETRSCCKNSISCPSCCKSLCGADEVPCCVPVSWREPNKTGVNCVSLCSLFSYKLPSDNRFRCNSDLSGGEPICLTAGLLTAQMRLFYQCLCFFSLFFLSLPACISVISRYKCLKNNLFDLFKKSQLDPISTSPQVSSWIDAHCDALH